MSTRERHLELGREANEYTHSWLVRGATNRPWFRDLINRWVSDGKERIRYSRERDGWFADPGWANVRTRLDELDPSEFPSQRSPVAQDDWLHALRTTSTSAKLTGVGNCGEHAAVAFIYLHDTQHARDWSSLILECQWSDSDPNHSWVVLGRAEDDDPSEPWNWVEEAVVVDPWHGRRGRVYPAADWRRRMYGGGQTRPQNIWRLAPVSYGRYRMTVPLFGGQ